MGPLLFLLIFSGIAAGQSLEEAVRTLTNNVLAPGEAAHVTERNIAPEFAAETARAKTLVEGALRRPVVREAKAVEIAVTATQNVAGPLIVLEIQKGDEISVETANYLLKAAQQARRPSLAMTLLWQQTDPILDIAVAADEMLVLSPAQIARLERAGGRWQAAETASLSALAPSRDPRGKLAVSGDSATAFLSGGTCTGAWRPSFQITCTQAAGEFAAAGEPVHFFAGQNTLETANSEKMFTLARAGDVRLTASTDGRIHASANGREFTFANWGSDLAAIATKCADTDTPAVIASSAAVPDSLTAYAIADSNARAVSEPLAVQGAVSALWSMGAGALAVIHETATGRYAAYTVSLDCGN